MPQARTRAVLGWIDCTFAKANEEHSRGVVLGLQADMWDATAPLSALTGDTEIVRSIAEHSRAFGKPVLLINGDRHVFGVDSPLADPTTAFNQWYAITTPVPNLTRLTVQGSTSTPSSWVRLTINEADPGLSSVEEVPVVFSVVRRDSAWRDLASSPVPAGSRRRRTRDRAR